MAEQDAARTISTLIRMEEATREAYDAALGKLHTNKVAPSMQRFRDHHSQHVQELRQIAGQMGAQTSGSDATQAYYDTLIDSVRQARSYDGVFSTLRVAEAAVKIQYDQALQSELPEVAMQAVRVCAKDEAEHTNVLEIATHGLAHV